MLSKTFAVLATSVAVASASPLSVRTSHNFGGFGGFGQGVSFNNFGGSLGHFDNFFGVDNFSGFHQNQILVQESQRLVCRSVDITIVQQRLAVIQEFAKRIITQQVCEVETQVVAFQQFISGCNDFQFDLHRRSGRNIGFDSGIAGHIGGLVGSDGQLTVDNLGFTGSDIGSQFVPVSGSNWVDATSPGTVGGAFSIAQNAAAQSSPAGDINNISIDSAPPADDSTPPPEDVNAPPPSDVDSAEAPGVTAATQEVPPPPPQVSTCAGCSD